MRVVYESMTDTHAAASFLEHQPANLDKLSSESCGKGQVTAKKILTNAPKRCIWCA
jgi:hypothetical protein